MIDVYNNNKNNCHNFVGWNRRKYNNHHRSNILKLCIEQIHKNICKSRLCFPIYPCINPVQYYRIDNPVWGKYFFSARYCILKYI